MRLLSLPENARAELGLSEDLVDKVRQGLPLWEQPNAYGSDGALSAQDEDEELEDELSGGKRNKNELSDDEKKKRICYGEGMYYVIPSFYRTLSFLKK